VDKKNWAENSGDPDDPKKKVPAVVDLAETSPPRKKMKVNSDEKRKIGSDVDMKQIKELCRIDWTAVLRDSEMGGSFIQEVNLSLSIADGRSSTEKKTDLIKNYLIFTDPNHIDSRHNSRDGGLIFGHHGAEDEEFDTKAVKPALQKNGSIDNIYKFS
jgi:hypothetical protein